LDAPYVRLYFFSLSALGFSPFLLLFDHDRANTLANPPRETTSFVPWVPAPTLHLFQQFGGIVMYPAQSVLEHPLWLLFPPAPRVVASSPPPLVVFFLFPATRVGAPLAKYSPLSLPLLRSPLRMFLAPPKLLSEFPPGTNFPLLDGCFFKGVSRSPILLLFCLPAFQFRKKTRTASPPFSVSDPMLTYFLRNRKQRKTFPLVRESPLLASTKSEILPFFPPGTTEAGGCFLRGTFWCSDSFVFYGCKAVLLRPFFLKSLLLPFIP